MSELALSREETITDGGIPEEIFDYVDGELSKAAHGFWTATADRNGIRYHDWQVERRLEIGGQWKGYFKMERPGPRTKNGYIRVIGPARNNFGGQKIYYRGPLTLQSAKEAVTVALRALS